jgi:hypothetical protein
LFGLSRANQLVNLLEDRLVQTLPASAMPPESVAGLLDLLEKAGGCVQVLDPPEQVRAAWRRLIHEMRAGGHVPCGWHLVHRGRDAGDLVLELRRGTHPSKRYQPSSRRQIPIPDLLVDPHPVVDRLRDQPNRLPESDENRSRTLLFLQALVNEAGKRGCEVRSSEKALLTVVDDGQPFDVRVWEETGARWRLRLVVTIDGADHAASEWKDYARKRIEDELPAILADLRRRGRRLHERQEAAARAEQLRIQQERDRAVTAHRDQILRQQVGDWLLAEDIRAYCADLLAAGMAADDPWLTWAHNYADSVDPLAEPPCLPPDPPPSQETTRAPRQRSAPSQVDSAVPQARPWRPNRRWYHG